MIRPSRIATPGPPALLKEWLRSGVLREDPHPAYYLYSQTFEVEGQTYTLQGVPRAGSASSRSARARSTRTPSTTFGPKADRLALFNATKYNLSPIFGLYPDDNGEVIKLAEAGIRDRTPQEATDHLGVTNRLWEIQDPKTITALQGLMAPKPVFIADGHHRYETGLKFREELEAKGELSGPDDPANFCLMMLVGMSDLGLIIQPTHRLVQGFVGLTSEALAARLRARVHHHHDRRGRGRLSQRLGYHRDRGRARYTRLRHRRGWPVVHRQAPQHQAHGSAHARP